MSNLREELEELIEYTNQMIEDLQKTLVHTELMMKLKDDISTIKNIKDIIKNSSLDELQMYQKLIKKAIMRKESKTGTMDDLEIPSEEEKKTISIIDAHLKKLKYVKKVLKEFDLPINDSNILFIVGQMDHLDKLKEKEKEEGIIWK